MGETPCLLSIFTPRKRRLLVLLGGTLVADRQQHFLLTGSGLARLLAFRRLEIRQDTNVSHQSHCHSRMRRRVLASLTRMATTIVAEEGARCGVVGMIELGVGRSGRMSVIPSLLLLDAICFTATQYWS